MESIEPTKAVCRTLCVAVTNCETSYHTSAIFNLDNSISDEYGEADSDNAAISGIAERQAPHTDPKI